jgi:hypothetical protein
MSVDGNNPSDIEEITAAISGPQVSKSTIVIVRMNAPVESMHLHFSLYSIKTYYLYIRT